MTSVQRDSTYRLLWNQPLDELLDFDKSQNFDFVDWSTYSFAGRKVYDPHTGNKLDDDRIIGRFITFLNRMSKYSGKPLHPLLWVSSPEKHLHFHVLEYHNGITRKQRAVAFRKTFGAYTNLPKDLYSTIIKATRTEDYHNCFYYSSRGHNQIKTRLIVPAAGRTHLNK